jgi:hypothetical protein
MVGHGVWIGCGILRRDRGDCEIAEIFLVSRLRAGGVCAPEALILLSDLMISAGSVQKAVATPARSL